MIERLDDETKAIDENELVNELSRLVGSKRTAIGHIAAGPAMKCGYCGARVAFTRLGRIRKRVLMKRVPAGTQDKHIKLGDGWWWQRLGPDACVKCGTSDPQPVGY